MVIKIRDNFHNIQLKTFLYNHLKLSHNEIKRLKMNNGIIVNDQPVTVKYILQNNDVLILSESQKCSENIPIYKQEPDIIYEDNDIVALNKPCGIAVHPSQHNRDITLAGMVMYHYKDCPFVFRAVGRLDKYTSGIVLIAKNAIACNNLCKQIKEKNMIKQYVAITDGIPYPESGVIDLPISRDPESIIKRVISYDGKPSVTEYKVILSKNGEAFVRLKPITGRTHQIRVHMAAIGCPLKYDFLYGKEEAGKTFLLHCERLIFSHPISNKIITIDCPAPFKL